MTLGKFRISLLALLAFGMSLSRPAEAHARNDTSRLPAVTIRTIVRRITRGQTLALARVALRYAGQRGNVTGQVVLPSGQAVNSRIKVTLSGYRITYFTVYTDNKGRFVIPNVSDGTYTLEVQADSDLYEPVTQEVRVIYGAHPGLIITLREKKHSASKSNTNVISAGELAQEVPDGARKEFEKGAQFSNEGKIQDAIERFKKALAIFPAYLMARNNLGVQYLKQGQWPKAAEQFEAAIEIDSKALNPRQNLAIALIEQKKYAQAIEHLNRAISMDSSSSTTHLYAGIASLGIDEIDQAERELSTALSLGGAENAHFYLALVHLKKGEREPAVRELKAYLEKLPKGEKAPRARQLLEKLR